MLYREAGQFKSTYAQDLQIFPILQDRIAMAALLVVAFVVVPLIGNQYWLSAILTPFLALATLGLNILTGYAGQLSLGTAAFMAVGAFMAYNAMLRIPHMPILGAFIIGGLCAAAVGIVFGLPSFRIKGLYLAVATLACQFFVLWAINRVGWLSNYSSSGVISAQRIEILGYPVEHAQRDRACLHGGPRHGRRRERDRHPDDEDEAAGLRHQLVLLRRRRSTLRVLLPRHGRAGGLHARSLIPRPLHGDHRRRGIDPGLVPRRRVHHAVPDLPEPSDQVAGKRPGHRDLTRPRVQLRSHHLRRPDHLLPDRRAERPGPPVADHQGEAPALALSSLAALYSRSAFRNRLLGGGLQ